VRDKKFSVLPVKRGKAEGREGYTSAGKPKSPCVKWIGKPGRIVPTPCDGAAGLKTRFSFCGKENKNEPRNDDGALQQDRGP